MKKIAISSAKGGVGKTTISYLMAKKLKDTGLNVGLFDGDLYGPNILNLFDVNPSSFKSFNDKKYLEPLVVDGIQIASVELILNKLIIRISGKPKLNILNKQETVFWRGPMISKVLKSMFQNVSWADLDYLIIDMPPGTGDPYLTMFNDLDINESLLICKDDLMSIEDSKKTVQLLNRFNIKILGCIENMSENFKLGQKAINSKTLNSHFHNVEVIGVIPRLTKKEIKKVYNNASDLYDYLPDLN